MFCRLIRSYLLSDVLTRFWVDDGFYKFAKTTRVWLLKILLIGLSTTDITAFNSWHLYVHTVLLYMKHIMEISLLFVWSIAVTKIGYRTFKDATSLNDPSK